MRRFQLAVTTIGAALVAGAIFAGAQGALAATVSVVVVLLAGALASWSGCRGGGRGRALSFSS
jgi:hypothetical protein